MRGCGGKLLLPVCEKPYLLLMTSANIFELLKATLSVY